MKNHFLPLILLAQVSFAQTTIVLQPDAAAGKDARVFNLDALANYGNDPDFITSQWEYAGGEPGTMRSMIQFDLSAIPEGAGILDARLSLYYNPESSTPGQAGNNAAYLRRITAPWSESTVNWVSQPQYTTVNQVLLPESTFPDQDYINIDVAPLVRDMVMYPNTSHGFMFMLQEVEGLHSMKFYSSDGSVPTKRPRLEVTYTLNPVTCITLVAGNGSKDARLYSLGGETNYGNDPELIAAAWVFDGNVGIMRSVIEFDLSSIPQGAEVSSAQLSLHYNPNSSLPGHDGPNTALLQRITEPWNEQSVTWGNQPATTTENQVTLPASTTSTQDYLDIDVAALVNDMVDEGNYGFLLRLMTEETFRALKFASGDHGDEDLHPTLEVCYTSSVANQEIPVQHIDVHPNPFSNEIYINAINNAKQISIHDLQGKTVFNSNLHGEEQFIYIGSLNELVPGVYYLRVVADEGYYVARVVKN